MSVALALTYQPLCAVVDKLTQPPLLMDTLTCGKLLFCGTSKMEGKAVSNTSLGECTPGAAGPTLEVGIGQPEVSLYKIAICNSVH